MTPEEILSHRKKKFLSVGRSKGFVSNNTDNLINEQNFLQKFKNKTNLKKLIPFIFLFFILISLWVLS